MAEGFEKLAAWQKSIDLAERVYKTTQDFPDSERIGLVAQMRRSSCSIGSNIAEGYGRVGRGDYIKHLGNERGSAFELKTQIVIARRIGLCIDEDVVELCREVIMILCKLMASLGANSVREEQDDY